MNKDKEDFKEVMDSYSPEVIEALVKRMEEMANAPREEMGKRQPGERCMYEIYNSKKTRLD